jgi:hypothetical protein
MSPSPFIATSRLKTIGKSMKTTCSAVNAKSCIIVSAGTSSGRLTVNSPLASARWYVTCGWKMLPYPKKCSSPVVGQIFGCAVIEFTSLPPKS